MLVQCISGIHPFHLLKTNMTWIKTNNALRELICPFSRVENICIISDYTEIILNIWFTSSP